MNQRLNRIEPKLPVQAMETYAIKAPLATHFRKAMCKEVECQAYQEGWLTLIDESSQLGLEQASYLRYDSGRHFKEMRSEEAGDMLKRSDIPGGLTAFFFFPGQEAFPSPEHEHQIRLDRPEIFLKVGGDWRGYTTVPKQMRVDDWVDSFEEHQDTLARAIERG